MSLVNIFENNIGIKLTAGSTIIIIFVFIFGGLILHSRQSDEGKSLLDTLSLDITYTNPIEGETVGYISPLINGSDIDGEITMTVKYRAYNFDRTKSQDIREYEMPFSDLDMPFSLDKQEIDTAGLYTSLGNKAEVCVGVDVVYKGVLLGSLLGYPNKSLEERCTPVIVQFGG